MQYVTAIIFYIVMSLLVFKHFSEGFELTERPRRVLKWLPGLPVLIYCAAVLLEHFFPNGADPVYYILYCILYYVSVLAMIQLPALCASGFLAKGLSVLFPSGRRWWFGGALIIFMSTVFFRLYWQPFRVMPIETNFIAVLLKEFGFHLVVLAILYKIITGTTLAVKEKHKGLLLVIFSLGILPMFYEQYFGMLVQVLGLYGVIYVRVAGGFKLSPTVRRVLLMVMTLGFLLSIPQVTFWGNRLGIRPLYFIGGAWLGLVLMGFTLFAMESLLDLFWKKHHRQRATVVLVILFCAWGFSLYNASRPPVVVERSVALKNLPPDLNGFSIVQVSDLHLGDLGTPGRLKETVDTVNRLNPDIIAITGDLIDGGFGEGKNFIADLKRFKAKYGIFAVTGNHEYYGNRLHRFLETARAAGFRVLRNETVTVKGDLQLAGMNDTIAGSRDEEDYPANLNIALRHMDKSKPAILLFHKPHMFNDARSRGIGLQLSGHTHAGQFPPLSFISYSRERFFYGLYRRGDAYISVSSGTGLYSIPMRLFTRNEIVRITLHPPK
jgi:uncharacterized protein